MVSDDRVRFLNQFEPLRTEVDYLASFKTEEGRLRAVIEHDFAEHTEELVIALNTGMRRSEQYRRIAWSCVDLVRKDLWIPQSKNGEGRHIPLNAEARAAFESLRQRSVKEGPFRSPPAGPFLWGEEACHCKARAIGSRMR